MSAYRGRIAPTPTGYLHLGHARTFFIAMQRAQDNNGTFIFRNEDLDTARCKKEFVDASIKDLQDCGLSWDEGPDAGGPHAPYVQSQRMDWYLQVWKKLERHRELYTHAQNHVKTSKMPFLRLMKVTTKSFSLLNFALKK